MTRAALALRIARAEAGPLGPLAAAVLGFAGGLLLRLLAFNVPLSCFRSSHSGDGLDSGCAGRSDYNDYLNLAADVGMSAVLALALLPFVLGLILRVAVISKDLARGTVALAW